MMNLQKLFESSKKKGLKAEVSLLKEGLLGGQITSTAENIEVNELDNSADKSFEEEGDEWDIDESLGFDKNQGFHRVTTVKVGTVNSSEISTQEEAKPKLWETSLTSLLSSSPNTQSNTQRFQQPTSNIITLPKDDSPILATTGEQQTQGTTQSQQSCTAIQDSTQSTETSQTAKSAYVPPHKRTTLSSHSHHQTYSTANDISLVESMNISTKTTPQQSSSHNYTNTNKSQIHTNQTTSKPQQTYQSRHTLRLQERVKETVNKITQDINDTQALIDEIQILQPLNIPKLLNINTTTYPTNKNVVINTDLFNDKYTLKPRPQHLTL